MSNILDIRSQLNRSQNFKASACRGRRTQSALEMTVCTSVNNRSIVNRYWDRSNKCQGHVMSIFSFWRHMTHVYLWRPTCDFDATQSMFFVIEPVLIRQKITNLFFRHGKSYSQTNSYWRSWIIVIIVMNITLTVDQLKVFIAIFLATEYLGHGCSFILVYSISGAWIGLPTTTF